MLMDEYEGLDNEGILYLLVSLDEARSKAACDSAAVSNNFSLDKVFIIALIRGRGIVNKRRESQNQVQNRKHPKLLKCFYDQL